MFLKHLLEKKTEIQTKENLGKRLLSKRKKIECLYYQTLQNMCFRYRKSFQDMVT